MGLGTHVNPVNRDAGRAPYLGHEASEGISTLGLGAHVNLTLGTFGGTPPKATTREKTRLSGTN
eukprot:3172648-Pyramimonas_sp.AAC.1